MNSDTHWWRTFLLSPLFFKPLIAGLFSITQATKSYFDTRDNVTGNRATTLHFDCWHVPRFRCQTPSNWPRKGFLLLRRQVCTIKKHSVLLFLRTFHLLIPSLTSFYTLIIASSECFIKIEMISIELLEKQLLYWHTWNQFRAHCRIPEYDLLDTYRLIASQYFLHWPESSSEASNSFSKEVQNYR